MLGHNLKNVYSTLVGMGLVRGKRQFSRDYLGRHWSYLRDFEMRDRGGVRVSARTVRALTGRLRAVARFVPVTVRREIEQVLAAIERDLHVADLLGY